MKRAFLKLAAVTGLVLAISACGGSDDPAPVAAAPVPPPTKNIVEVAVGASPEFTTLVTALKAAGLDATLATPGPFTVFAPTNTAFAKIPPATLTALLADKAALTKILTYHVVAGKVLKADVVPLIGKPIATVAGPSATFVVGSDLKITDQKGGVSTITATDTLATNGVIHTIDTVLMPN